MNILGCVSISCIQQGKSIDGMDGKKDNVFPYHRMAAGTIVTTDAYRQSVGIYCIVDIVHLLHKRSFCVLILQFNDW